MPSAPPNRNLTRELTELLHARTPLRPRVAMLLGSGHASITNQLKDKVVLHGDDLAGVRMATPVLVGLLEGVAVAVADAPLASYEGLSAAELAQPVRALGYVVADDADDEADAIALALLVRARP
jgi:hypothetical protein